MATEDGVATGVTRGAEEARGAISIDGASIKELARAMRAGSDGAREEEGKEKKQEEGKIGFADSHGGMQTKL